MRRMPYLIAALSMAAALPAAAQDRAAFAAHGTGLYFRAEAPFARVVLPYTVQQVWEALPEAYRLIGFTATPGPDSTKKDVVTSYMHIQGQLYPGELNSVYFDCSRNSRTGPIADQGEITFALLSRVEQAPNGTAVLTQLTARLRRRDSSQYPVDCASTGKLEASLASFLVQHLQAPRPEVRGG